MKNCNYFKCIYKLIENFSEYASKASFIPNIIARIYLADIFFSSGIAKISNWKGTLFLFEYEYNVPLLSPTIAAYSATIIELVCPIFLVLGLGTRFISLILFMMSYVIILSYVASAENYYWMLIFAILTTSGGNKLSVDYLIKRHFHNKSKKKL